MSLPNKLFISYAVISLVLLGFIFAAVELRVRQQVSADTVAELERTKTAFLEHWRSLRQRLGREGAIVADAPKLKAAVDTGDPATVQPVAAGYREMIEADFFELRDRKERLLARWGEGQVEYLKVSFPLAVGGSRLGLLTIGHRLDDAFAVRMKQLVDAEVALVKSGGLAASTLPREREAELERAWSGPAQQEPRRLKLGGESYLALSAPGEGASGVSFVVLRSLDESLRFLGAVRRDLILLGVLTTALALGASYLTARALTRPLNAIVQGMKEMARSGDLTREIHLERRDEEAGLVASSFNQLARSLLAFQKEAEHKERLSSLGRLSATLAHEIRNPLTIIKGSALALLEDGRLAAEAREPLSDILQEVERLNRLVVSVLDSAKPATYRIEETNINQICRECLAALNGEPSLSIQARWDPSLESGRVDPARLKQVLLNVLLNARDAIRGEGTISVETHREAPDYAIRISDTGEGISQADLPNVFDPFFTRKRSGTGLGLTVARNIVEGLGGRIEIRSEAGRGTSVELRLPLAPRIRASPAGPADQT